MTDNKTTDSDDMFGVTGAAPFLDALEEEENTETSRRSSAQAPKSSDARGERVRISYYIEQDLLTPLDMKAIEIRDKKGKGRMDRYDVINQIVRTWFDAQGEEQSTKNQ